MQIKFRGSVALKLKAKMGMTFDFKWLLACWGCLLQTLHFQHLRHAYPPGVVVHYRVKFPVRLKHPSGSSLVGKKNASSLTKVCMWGELFAQRGMLTIWGAFTPQYFCGVWPFHSWPTRHISSQKLTQVSNECLRLCECFPLVHKNWGHLLFLIHSVQKKHLSLLQTTHSNCKVMCCLIALIGNHFKPWPNSFRVSKRQHRNMIDLV